MIFADTSAWAALTVLDDEHRGASVKWFAANSLITTDYVIDETLTLLRARGELARSLEMRQALVTGMSSAIEWITPQDVRSAWDVFCQFDDKQWILADCVSKVVMQRLQITTAFTFDSHFQQFGTVSVDPALE